MENQETKFELRPLEGSDIFVMTSIISKIGVRNIAKCFDSQEIQEAKKEDAANTEKIGTLVFCNIADLVLERLEYCEDGICKLLSRLSGKPAAEIKQMEAIVYLEMFMQVVQDENFADFFTHAYELLKRMM